MKGIKVGIVGVCVSLVGIAWGCLKMPCAD